MSKYTYTRVENLSDLDITGNIQYYLFEEGVGHKFYAKSIMMKSSLYELDSYIDNGLIFTREEKPWYLRIPEKGVLCESNWSKGYRLIVSYDEEDYLVYDEDDNHYDAHSMTPLSNNKIKQFLQEEE